MINNGRHKIRFDIGTRVVAIDDVDDGVIAGKSGTVISHHNNRIYNTTIEFDEEVRDKWGDVAGHEGYWGDGTPHGRNGFCYNMNEDNLELEYILADFATPDIKLLFGGE